jgi:hypothetical protein
MRSSMLFMAPIWDSVRVVHQPITSAASMKEKTGREYARSLAYE